MSQDYRQGQYGQGYQQQPTVNRPEGYVHLSADQQRSQQTGSSSQQQVNWDTLVDQVFREEIRDWALGAQQQQGGKK